MQSVLKRLARLRVPLGFLFGIVVLWLARPTPRTLLIGAGIALCGELFRIWAAGHLEKGREVTISGPYRLTRHPLYFGSTLIGIGLAVAAANVVVAVIVISYLAVTLTAAIRTEEAHLTEKFGSAYPQYRAGKSAGAERGFSVERAVRNREYRAAVGVVLVFLILLWKLSIAD